MHKYIKVTNTGVPIQIFEGVLDIFSKSTKNFLLCKTRKVGKSKKSVLPRTW